MSLAMRATSTLLRVRAGRARPDARTLAELMSRTYPAAAPVPDSLLRDYRLTETTLAGRPVLRLTPRGTPSGQHLIYTHGGGYVRPLIAPHWQVLERATRDTGATITVPLYHLAPEGGVTGAYKLLRELYTRTAAEAGAENITLAGDSSGGGLALGQAVTYRNAGEPSPRQIVLFSPWVDITMSNPEIATLAPRDPTLDADILAAAGRLWAGDTDRCDARLSPMHADLSGLAPVHLFQGGRDILAADARVLAARLKVAGNQGTFTFVAGGFHVYVGAVRTPESRAALAAVRALLRAPTAG
jgi:epsilon-lactone hydrolase